MQVLFARLNAFCHVAKGPGQTCNFVIAGGGVWLQLIIAARHLLGLLLQPGQPADDQTIEQEAHAQE